MPELSVSSQNHYLAQPIQHIEYACINRLEWREANITKYVARWKHKNGLEDLKKAASYLKCLMYEVEHGKFKTPDQIEKEGYLI
jgi:hypothetical protein